MYISMIVILIAFAWLLVETDYMRVQLVGNQTTQFTTSWYPALATVRDYADDFLTLVGIVFPTLITLFMNYVFFSAYFTPQKAILININSANEANLEAVLIPFITILALIGAYKILLRWGKGKLLET